MAGRRKKPQPHQLQKTTAILKLNIKLSVKNRQFQNYGSEVWGTFFSLPHKKRLSISGLIHGTSIISWTDPRPITAERNQSFVELKTIGEIFFMFAKFNEADILKR